MTASTNRVNQNYTNPYMAEDILPNYFFKFILLLILFIHSFYSFFSKLNTKYN